MQAVNNQTRTYQMVRMAMDRMIKDLTCAYAPSREIEDTAITYYRFIGEDLQSVTAETDKIFFTTASEIGLGEVSGLCEVDYFLREMEDKDDLYYLMRREDCTPHEGVSEAGRVMEVAEDVVALNITYLDDQGSEKDQWDLQKNLQLPEQVRIRITVRKGDEDISFAAVAALPMGGYPLNIKKDEEEEN